MNLNNTLVVGGAGYVGSTLCKHLVANNHNVRCVDNGIYGNAQSILFLVGNKNFTFKHCDLRMSSALVEDIEWADNVVLLAGLVGDPITKKYPDLSSDINTRGLVELIDMMAGRDLRRVVFVSTCSNYGLMEEGKIADENSVLNPLSLYAEAKVSIEKYILSLKNKVDYAPTILRFATAFGLSPRMRFDLTVSEFTRELALGNDLLVYDPDTWRPYCHVEDFSALILKVLHHEKKDINFEVFNAGGDQNNSTKRQIVDLILKYKPDSSVTYQEKGADPRNYRVSFKKVNEVLSFYPKKSIEDGVLELLQAFENNVFSEIGYNENKLGNYSLDHVDA